MPATLLLADDSVTIQRVIEMTFAEEDVRVVTVGDGREAIERIAADPPDIVLADTNMPEKDGYEVSAFVKAESARSGIPVVLLTGAFEPVDDERAREVGCDAVLVKPFEPTAVLNRVRELLGRPADAGTAAAAAEPAAAAGNSATPAAGDGGSGDAAGEPLAAPASGAPDVLPAAPDSEGRAAADAPPADPDAAAPAAVATSAASDTVAPAAAAPPAAPEAAAPVADAPSAAPEAADASPAAPGSGPPSAPDEGPGDAPPAAHDEKPGDAPVEEAGDAAPPVPAVPAVEAPAPSLAAAFAALLAAEQGDLDRARAAYPWPRQAAPPDEEDLVERVAERVVERLSDDITGELVSEVVARVAERLVRDQIGRIEPA